MNAITELKPEAAALAAVPETPPQRPLSVIEHAMRSGATPDQLERLLDLQVRADNHQLELMREKRRMDEEDRLLRAKLAFDDAMTRFRGYAIVVPKTKEVIQKARDGGPGPRFMQSEFDVVCGLLAKPLSECGLSFRHDMRFASKKWTTDGQESDVAWVYVACHLTHRDGHTETLELEGPPDTSGAKNPLQEMQSTASYLKRQSLLAITGTATGGEDDENKLKARGKAGAQQQDSTDTAALEALLATGRDEALKGMAALNKWWAGLTPRQQKDLSPDFGGMRKAARLADEKGQA